MVFGIDSHKETLAVCGVDEIGRQQAAMEFPNSPSGHAALLEWAIAQGGAHVFAIEVSGGFGRALARYLAAKRQTVLEIQSRLTTRERRRLRPRGKSDPGDALAIARVAVREDHLPQPSSLGLSRQLRELVDYREQLVGERTRCANRLHADLVDLCPGYQVEVKNLVSKRYLARAERLRRRAEGKSWREAIRCLKRHLSNVIYRQLVVESRADVAARAVGPYLSLAPPPARRASPTHRVDPRFPTGGGEPPGKRKSGR